MGKGDIICIGCMKEMGNGDTCYFWKSNATTYIFCKKCNLQIEGFILKLREKNEK